MTRDEFIDIMSKIDETLIDGALDISQPETVEAVYERPPVLRYIMSIAACVAVLAAAVIAVPYFKGILTQPGDSSESAGSSVGSSVSVEYDFIRGWDPEELVYNEFGDFLYVGGNARVCTAELDGITAELILHNIKKEAGTELVNELTGFDYTEYIGAEDIVLYIHDNRGRRFIAASVTPHSYNDMELINVNCLFNDCTRLYRTDNSEYVLMQYADCNGGALIASFYSVDLERQTLRDENGIYDASAWRAGIVGNRRIGGWQYGYQASKEFGEYTAGRFHDPAYGYDIYWNGSARIMYPDEMPEVYENIDIENITGWDPERLTILDNAIPTEGMTVIAASDSAGGLTASLILHNVVKRPGERHYIYSEDKYLDMLAAEDICLYITDAEGRKALLELPVPLSDGFVKFLPGICVFDGCIKVLHTYSDGTERPVIMLHLADKDGGIAETYIQGDPDLYAASPKDENGIYLAKPIFTNVDYVSPYTPEYFDGLEESSESDVPFDENISIHE